MGKDLYDYVRGLDPQILINNRVDKGRQGMQGLTKEGDFCGDFGTPEQEIPAQGLPGVDWETCMTMNQHRGWNKNDAQWKSTSELVRKLIDVASKGGNFLLNVGPKPDGNLPEQAVDRLEGIGRWMGVNSESIYGTTASPFKKLDWGRCTKKVLAGATVLYLHVFDWPRSGRLLVPGLHNAVESAALLADGSQLRVTSEIQGVVIEVPANSPDEISSTIILKIAGTPDVQ